MTDLRVSAEQHGPHTWDFNQTFLYLNEIKNSRGSIFVPLSLFSRLASVGILGKEREPGVGKLGWHGNFDTVQNPVCVLF